MDTSLRAIETRGRVVDARHIETVSELPVGRQVRVVILRAANDEEFSESEWLAAAARNPAFAFLGGPEDIYSPEDGEPFGRP